MGSLKSYKDFRSAAASQLLRTSYAPTSPYALRISSPPAPFPQNKMKLDMKEFESDFERLHQFLVGEQALLLHQLEDRYEVLLGTQNSNISHLEEQGAALSRLIAEAEDKSKQDGLQLLKVIHEFCLPEFRLAGLGLVAATP